MDQDDASISSEDDRFENDIQIFRDYSFISIETDEAFGMHALVQLATRKWLKAHGQFERWNQFYIRNLSAEFPAGNYENWTRWQKLFPHVKLAVGQRPRTNESLRDWALLVYNAARYA